jgi:hypothetical protein
LKQSVYISKASVPFSSESLKALAESASRNNQALNVTGLLIYASGYFIQLLEGNSSDVDSLYFKIKTDSRHTDVNLIFEHYAVGSKRLCQQWSMNYFNVDSSTDFPPELKNKINTIINYPNATTPVLSLFDEFVSYLM